VGYRSGVVTAGVRAAERWLLAEALACASESEADPVRLTRPVRVVVPSRSLLLHLQSRLVAERGRPVLGLKLQTLGGLAAEVTGRWGGVLPEPALFPIRVRREARRETALAEGLEPLLDGYGSVVGAVDDLLDAGFEIAHAEALEEHLASQPGAPGTLARARALVRVAGRVARLLDAGEVGHRSQLFVRARECLERDPGRLRCRALFVYGFADATGVQADLIAMLRAQPGARLVLDSPTRFGAGFRERLGVAEAAEPVRTLTGGGAGTLGGAPSPVAVRVLRAPGRSAEVRAVAERLRGLVDAGASPERLAVVARDLAPYRVPLRLHLRRLGVPFSGLLERGAATPARRRLNALLALIEQGEPAGLEPWLAARSFVETMRGDLRHAFHLRGALRLDEVARFAGWAPDRSFPLEARRGLLPAEGEKPARAARRHLEGGVLAAAGRSAQSLLRRVGARPARAPIQRHHVWLTGIVESELLWGREDPARQELEAALATLPAEPEVDAEEFSWLLRSCLEGAGFSRIGGEGGGVQLLSVMEARARCFDRLFVLGMVRGSFPRTISDDALLPDAIRARLREVLPALPVKREGHDEERFLFEKLLSASEDVTLCWSETNDAGRPQPRSPLIESLERRVRRVVHESAPPLHAPRTAAVSLPARERALLAGLHESRAAFTAAFDAALAEQGRTSDERVVLVASRLAVLDEVDAHPSRRQLLGPYFGFIGDARDPADPRRAPLFVTRLENFARCPWQAFLSRLLRLAPPPDAAHQLPAADDRRLLGNVVHGVLERIARGAAAAWPDDATLERWLEVCSVEELRDESNPLPGYARVLALRARPYLERARLCDWGALPPPVVGTEVQSGARVLDAAGCEREIRFKADRVDRAGPRTLLTDYKTGRPIASQKKLAARMAQLRGQVANGRALQAMLYARAGGEGAVGRYLFLSERTPDEARSLEATDEPSLAGPFDAALRTLLEAWDRGSFLPRLREAERDEEPGACRFCEVKDACLRGDSGARLRLEGWFEGEGASSAGVAERAAAGLFSIGTEPS
jgi:RecB family exonuclease